MAWRILVGLKDNVRDARGERVKREIHEHLGVALRSVRTVDVYTVDAQLSAEEVAAARNKVLEDPLRTRARILSD